jgi:hypothetical protein
VSLRLNPLGRLAGPGDIRHLLLLGRRRTARLEQAASTQITSLGAAYSTSAAVSEAESQLTEEARTWATDFQDFENAVGATA